MAEKNDSEKHSRLYFKNINGEWLPIVSFRLSLDETDKKIEENEKSISEQKKG